MVEDIEVQGSVAEPIAITQPARRASPRWWTYGAMAGVMALGLLVLATAAFDPFTRLGIMVGGAFWLLPAWVWFAVAVLAALALLSPSSPIRFTAIITFGLATMGLLGYLEPLGVFHDSWQNVGLGQLTTLPAQAEAARQVPYVGSSPNAFLYFGILSHAFPDTSSFLRLYPLFCLLIYSAGLYLLANAFAHAHGEQFINNPARFSQMTVFAFLALAPNFLVRVNPAPQSLAFALMPFCLAAMVNGLTNPRFRGVALAIFVVIVFTHSITSAVIVAVGAAWLVLERLTAQRRRLTSAPLVNTNTVILYLCVYLSWLIYVGVWIIRSGGSFARRMLEVLNSGQHATVTATATETLISFIWLHRVALGGTALLILVGMLLVFLAHRTAGLRLIAWLSIAAAWLPLLLFGEFADRGPLFASLPAAVAVGFALSREGGRYRRWAVNALMFVTALTTFITAYSNHIGEVITKAEASAFARIVQQSGDQKLIYGYAPPLTGEALAVYSSDRIRTYALGAADFSYERLTVLNGVIVISEQMQQAAAQRGPQALAQLEDFKDRLLADERYELIFDNGKVVAFRARQP